MDLNKAFELAIHLITQTEKKHGLEPGLSIRFDRAKRRLGSYRPRNKVITLSAEITHLNEESVVNEVIRHEIAHALAHQHEQHLGHGQKWKKWARIMKADPRASCQSSDIVTPKAPYAYTCPKCDFKAERYRRPSKRIQRAGCPRCSSEDFFQPLKFDYNNH